MSAVITRSPGCYVLDDALVGDVETGGHLARERM
jgi:hypothetical protein